MLPKSSQNRPVVFAEKVVEFVANEIQCSMWFQLIVGLSGVVAKSGVEPCPNPFQAANASCVLMGARQAGRAKPWAAEASGKTSVTFSERLG